MDAARNKVLTDLRSVVAGPGDRNASFQRVAEIIREYGGFRWVGLYEVDRAEGVVKVIVWTGLGPPGHPAFPVTKGLTGAAIAARRTVNVGDVSADSRYLTAFGSTRSEIIVPVFDRAGRSVIGTIDVESETPNAFDRGVQEVLESCAQVIRTLWEQ